MMRPVTALLRLLDLVPQVLAAIAGLVVLWWGLTLTWSEVVGPTANWSAAAGLVVLTPFLAVLLAFVNFAFVSLVLWPVRWLVERSSAART